MVLSASLLIVSTLAFPQLGEGFFAYVVTDRVGEMHVELFVSPDGEVDSCVVLVSDFNAEVDDRLCSQARQKVVEVPAHDHDQQALYSTAIFSFRSANGQRRDEQSILRREPVIELFVDQLPASVDTELVVGLRVVVGADGQIEACEADTRDADAYTRVGCAQLQALTHLLRYSLQGEPVRYLTDMSVMFTRG